MGGLKVKSFCSNLAKICLNSMFLSEGFAFFVIPKIPLDHNQNNLSIKRYLREKSISRFNPYLDFGKV